jgi:hypothetical protein
MLLPFVGWFRWTNVRLYIVSRAKWREKSTQKTVTNERETRCYDLDWLRVLAVILLLFFHSARPFDTNGWHIKDTASSRA